MNEVYFPNPIFTLHTCFILYILLSVFYFEWYRRGDLPMLLDIKLVIIIYSKICSIVYYNFFLINACSFP